MDENVLAERTLVRFSVAIRTAVSSVLTTMGRERDYNLRQLLTQDAKIRVVTFAGLLPGWQSGKLPEWEELAEKDEHQVNLLLTRQLRLALSQIVGRQVPVGQSLDCLIGYDLEPQYFDNGDDIMEETEYRKRYPIMARAAFDGETVEEIAKMLDTSTRTIDRRIAEEKRKFLASYVRRNGLRLDGDETLDELQEAYNGLTHQRPTEKLRSTNTDRTGHRPVIGGLWFQEHCLDCNQPCNASSEKRADMCRCCVTLSGAVVNK